MSVTMTINDQDVIDHFNSVIDEKLRLARAFPGAIQNWKYTNGHTLETFLLGGQKLNVRMCYDGDGHRHMQFDCFEDPAYEMFVTQDGLRIEFGGEEDEAPSPEAMIQEASMLQVIPNDKVLYAWVYGETATVLINMAFVHRNEDESNKFSIGTDCYVLRGEDMPDELHMDVNDMSGWIKSFWEQVRAGRLVRISDRINAIGDGARFKSVPEDGGLGMIYLNWSDGQKPRLVPSTPYIFWHPKEKRPGQAETNRKNYDGQPINCTLKDYYL